MIRSNLVIYDPVTGRVWSQTGIAEGDILPHDYPVGLPYIEIPYEQMEGMLLESVDITDPENPVPILVPYGVT